MVNVCNNNAGILTWYLGRSKWLQHMLCRSTVRTVQPDLTRHKQTEP